MTDRDKKNMKNLLIVLAMLIVLVIGSIGAYFTATDEVVDSFTVGKIDVQVTEPKWSELPDENENDVPDVAECVLPNTQIDKDPTVENLSDDNEAFVFLKVVVPKADVLTATTASGAKAKESAITQLFQLNNWDNTKGLNGKAWNGNDTYNTDSWYLVSSNTENEDYNEYIFVYGSSTACKVLPAGESTEEPLFDSVTFCNVVEGQELETTSQDIKITAYAIQPSNLTSTDKVEPTAVWAILNAQSGTNP